MWLIPFFTSGVIGKFLSLSLNFAYELLLRLVSFVFYLASEYWGRWVLAALVVACTLLYGRWHYIEKGRSEEAAFRTLILEAELEERCFKQGGKVIDKPKNDGWRLPDGWPEWP